MEEYYSLIDFFDILFVLYISFNILFIFYFFGILFFFDFFLLICFSIRSWKQTWSKPSIHARQSKVDP
jgi:hypothetical protein